MKAFIISPKTEYIPIFIPNTTPAPAAIRKSVRRRVFPMLRLVCLLSILATISVPPVEALILNRIAEPIAGKMIEKISSSSLSSVRGLFIG